jgi:hypothetical protein
MKKEQMIKRLNDYCEEHECDCDCYFYNICKHRQETFSEMGTTLLLDLCARLQVHEESKEKSQSMCKLEKKRMKQAKVLQEVTRIIYSNKMEEVLPIKEFVENVTDKGYKVKLKRENVFSAKYDVIIYKEVEME